MNPTVRTVASGWCLCTVVRDPSPKRGKPAWVLYHAHPTPPAQLNVFTTGHECADCGGTCYCGGGSTQLGGDDPDCAGCGCDYAFDLATDIPPRV